ncbi:hypothetical protein [Pseudomonas delhiensis]|nr:hypothetical protein [Pseudomonas delhiensis]
MTEKFGNRIATTILSRLSELGYEVRESGSYAKLEAEAQALRDQVKALQSDANSYQSGYNEGRRMGTKHRQSEVEQLTREVEALRARVVVVPNDLLQRCREVLGWQKTGVLKGDALRSLGRKRWLGDPNELHLAENETAREAYRFIDELARLNGKVVSEDTLRVLIGHATGEIKHLNNGMCPDDLEGHDTRDPDCAVCRALLGEGKEVADERPRS